MLTIPNNVEQWMSVFTTQEVEIGVNKMNRGTLWKVRYNWKIIYKFLQLIVF